MKKWRIYRVKEGRPTRKVLYGDDENEVWTRFLNFYLKMNEEVEDFDMEEVK